MKSLRELLTITDCLSEKTNASQRYPKSRDHKDCKFSLRYLSLPYGTREKPRCILRSQKIRFIFYTESTFRELLCKQQSDIVFSYKSNVVHKVY